jgi:hypothetical protein
VAGYLQVLVSAGLQSLSAAHMRGRVVSVVMLCAYGLTPLSYVLTGALIKVSVSFMFVLTGVMLLLALVVCALGRTGQVVSAQTSN